MFKKFSAWLVFIINLLIICVGWWLISGKILAPAPYIALGRLTGLLAVYFILVEVLLISRLKCLEQSFGLDRLLKLHRASGALTLLFVLLHPIFLVIGYGQLNDASLWQQTISFLFSWDDMAGAFFGVGLFILVVFFSWTLIRKKLKYEFWYLTHLLVYLAIIVSYGHQLEVGTDLQHWLFAGYWYLLYTAAIAPLIYYRVLTPIYNFYRGRFQVEQIVSETTDSVSIYIKGNSLDRLKARAGQFFILRFLTKELWFEAHPFSLSAPTDGNTLRFTIKKLGDFSGKLPNTLHPGDYVLLDGPHGVFSAQAAQQDKFLMLAGGVGITPIKAIAEELAKKGADTTIIYGNKTKGDIIFYQELTDLQLKSPQTKVHHVLSQENSEGFLSGRLDSDKIKTLCPDYLERAVYVCGPPAMTKSILRTLKDLGLKKKNIHWEQFSW